ASIRRTIVSSRPSSFISIAGSPGISMRKPRSSRRYSAQSSARADDVVATRTAEVDAAAAKTDMSRRRDQVGPLFTTRDDIALSPFLCPEHHRSMTGAYLIVFYGDVIVSTDVAAIVPSARSALSERTSPGYGGPKCLSIREDSHMRFIA